VIYLMTDEWYRYRYKLYLKSEYKNIQHKL